MCVYVCYKRTNYFSTGNARTHAHTSEIVKNPVHAPFAIMLQPLRQAFCRHEDSFAYRKYGDYDFVEICTCKKCGKTLRQFKGFDEDIRG